MCDGCKMTENSLADVFGSALNNKTIGQTFVYAFQSHMTDFPIHYKVLTFCFAKANCGLEYEKQN